MKTNLLGAAAAGLLWASCASAQAASLSIIYDVSTGVQSVYLDGGLDNGQFDTIEFSAMPIRGGVFGNLDDGIDGTRVREAGEPFTFVNPLLDFPPLFGGLGYSVLGKTVTETEVSFTTGPLGTTIDTSGQPNGQLFLANFANGLCSSGVVTLYSAGNAIGSYDFTGCLPEPATNVLLLLGGAAAVVAGRRRVTPAR